MKTKSLLLILVAMIMLTGCSASAFEPIFSDVPKDAWEAKYVYDLVERKIVNGNGDGTFGPMDTVKRCEYAKMLVGITNTPLSTSISSPYSDVPNWEWYFPYVNSSLDFITGFTDNGTFIFKPEAEATREDVTVALVKALNIDLTPYADPTNLLSNRFTDIETISIHNRIYVAAAVDKGYINGDDTGTFRGQDPIIRAEVVAVLCRAFPAKK